MNGRILLFNGGAEQILGYDREEAIAGVNVVLLFPEGMAREILERMRGPQHGGRGSLSRQEVSCLAEDGTRVPVSLTGGLMYNHAGDEVATFGIFRDLRPIREMQNQLLQSEKMASLGRLAAGVAGEMNNPLLGIMLYAGLALELIGRDHQASADLKIVLNEAERARQIVADLLTFSQATPTNQVPLDLNRLIAEQVESLGSRTECRDVDIELRLSDALPQILGIADRLKLAFSNLLLNAVQAMQGRGKLTVGTRVRADGNMVESFVTDTGPGISEEALTKIFEPFYTTRKSAGGVGLGLSAAYAIVRENRGIIRVESEEGRGTTFLLLFPPIHVNLPEEGEGNG
jgi:PAS domain S-box-containing protein